MNMHLLHTSGVNVQNSSAARRLFYGVAFFVNAEE